MEPYNMSVHIVDSYLSVVLQCLACLLHGEKSIPQFIIKEASVIVKDIHKIHVDIPTNEVHYIYSKDGDLRIPLSLHRIFSYFLSRTPTFHDILN